MTVDRIPTGKVWWLEVTKEESIFNKAALRLSARVSASFVLGSISGVITSGVYISDTFHNWQQGDKDAAVAYGVAALSAAGSTGALISAAFGVGMAIPVFWALLALGAVAAVLASVFDDDNIDLLLVNGPLGGETENPDYAYLQQPQQAFYRLISYLMKPEITLADVNNDALGGLNQALARLTSATINKRVTVTLNFPNWFDMSSYRCSVKVTKKQQRYSERNGTFYGGEHKIVEIDKPIYQQTDLGLDIWLNVPSTNMDKGGVFSSPSRTEYTLQIKLQLLAKKSASKDVVSTQQWIFPAPNVEDNLGFKPNDATPDFDDDNQTFWYNKNGLSSSNIDFCLGYYEPSSEPEND